MNDNTQMTSAPGSSLLPDGTQLLTTVHLAFIAIFAVLVVIGILWGMRLKRARKRADVEVAEDNAAMAEAHHAPAAPEPAEPAVAPVSASPRVADDTLPGTTQPATATAPASGAAAEAIPLTTLKGLGPKVATRLAELGIADARDLARLDDGEAAALDAQLGGFAGRMARDRWIEQARLLAAGDRAGYEATFGRL